MNSVGGIDFQIWTAADYSTNMVRSIEIPEGVSVRFMMMNYWEDKNLGSNYKQKYNYDIGPFRGPTTKNIPDKAYKPYSGASSRYEKIYKVMFVDE